MAQSIPNTKTCHTDNNHTVILIEIISRQFLLHSMGVACDKM